MGTYIVDTMISTHPVRATYSVMPPEPLAGLPGGIEVERVEHQRYPGDRWREMRCGERVDRVRVEIEAACYEDLQDRIDREQDRLPESED